MIKHRNRLWIVSAVAFGMVAAGLALAADNSTVPVAVGTEIFANKDIGGVKYPKHILYDSSGAEVLPATSAQAGSPTETAPATDTASSGLNGRLQRIAQRLSSMIALLPTSLGAGGGLKVDGSGTALPVSGTVAVTGVATAANQSTTNSSVGATNESAAGTDTATSGLNGLIKRLLQSITTLNGKIDTLNTNVTAAIPAGPNEIGGVNVTKFAGTAAAVNSGNKDAGTQRVVIATDQLALATAGQGATAAAPPSGATQAGAVGSGATGGLLAGLKTCDLHAKYDASDNGSITMVTGVSGRKVYICGFILATGGTATNLKLREGSDANCATNGADLTPAYQLVANDKIGAHSAFWTGLAVSTNAYYVCVNASAGNAHQAEVWYTIQ